MRIGIEDSGYGWVNLYDTMKMPAALKAVNVARASFAKVVGEFSPKDEKLLRWLAKHFHTSPFRHSPITLQVRCPKVIAMQWYKHIVGSDYTFKDTGFNEVSGRYVRNTDVYVPEVLHCQAPTKKQGASSEIHKRGNDYLLKWHALNEQVYKLYNEMIDDGIATEEARFILPMGAMTEFFWTASPQALYHFVNLRNAPDAQGIIQRYAKAVNTICEDHYGILWQVMIEEMGK